MVRKDILLLDKSIKNFDSEVPADLINVKHTM